MTTHPHIPAHPHIPVPTERPGTAGIPATVTRRRLDVRPRDPFSDALRALDEGGLTFEVVGDFTVRRPARPVAA